jgi:type VI secretion system secreted protein Hcp
MSVLTRRRSLPVAALVIVIAAAAWWAARPASDAAPPARASTLAAGTLTLTGLPGASGDVDLPVLSFSTGASNNGGFSGGGGGAGRANFQDLAVTVNSSSVDPLLIRAVGTGGHLQRATLTIGSHTQEWRLDDVLVSSASVGRANAGPETLNVTFAYRKLQVSSLDRRGGVVESYCYDVVAAATC